MQLDAVPYFRSGLLLKFPVKRSRGALLTVVLENGEPLPAGAQAQIIGDNVEENEVFPAGLRGELYLTGLAASNRLRVTWREQSCEFDAAFPGIDRPAAHLGTYTCTGVGHENIYQPKIQRLPNFSTSSFCSGKYPCGHLQT